MADQPQTSLERMQANVAQIAQQRRQDAQMRNQAALEFESEIAENLANAKLKEKDEAISDAILAARGGSVKPTKTEEPNLLSSALSQMGSGGSDSGSGSGKRKSKGLLGFLESQRPTGGRSWDDWKADKVAKKEAEQLARDTRRARLAELAGKTTSASRALATFDSSSDLSDTA